MSEIIYYFNYRCISGEWGGVVCVIHSLRLFNILFDLFPFPQPGEEIVTRVLLTYFAHITSKTTPLSKPYFRFSNLNRVKNCGGL